MDKQALSEYYSYLLERQYWEKPNAKAEIEAYAKPLHTAIQLLEDIDNSFDLANATDARLDIIGRIVGVSRTVPLVIKKKFFGFKSNPESLGFADRFVPTRPSAPLRDKFSPAYTSQQLGNSDYLFFIRAKIAYNNVRATMVDEDGLSIQDVIQQLFDGFAYVVDNQDMTLTLYVSPFFDSDRLTLIERLDILPKPQGVRYNIVIQGSPVVVNPPNMVVSGEAAIVSETNVTAS